MTLEDLMEIALRNDFSLNQVGYMLYKEEGIKFPSKRITNGEIEDLVGRKVIDRQHKIDRKMWAKFKGATVIKKISYNMSKELKVFVDILRTQLVTHEMEPTTRRKVDSYFVNNEELGVHFYTWICMWPTDSDNNAGWENVFQVRHNQFKLRRVIEQYAKFFQKLARKPNVDMGLVMYGTFMFIRSHIMGNKAFIPKISTFIQDWEEWYERAYTKTYQKTGTQIINEAYDNGSRSQYDEGGVSQAGVVMV